MEQESQKNIPLESTSKPGESKWKAYLKKLGLAGFMFFLIKGLVWIAIFLGLGELACGA